MAQSDEISDHEIVINLAKTVGFFVLRRYGCPLHFGIFQLR
jgi:hypothetical protein